MKNSNPFLGVPSVSSNTLIKPNTEKRKTERDGRTLAGGEMGGGYEQMEGLFSYHIE